MTQAIVCYDQNGLVLATDSLTVQELEGGRVAKTIEPHLFPLGQHTAILAAGDAPSAQLCAQLAQWLPSRHLADVEDVLAVSRDFLAEGLARYAREQRRNKRRLPRHLCFIIGSYSPGRSTPGDAVLLQSTAAEVPFKEMHLGHVFTWPRRLVLEGRITRRLAEGESLRDVGRYCLAALEEVAARHPGAVGGPFQALLVSGNGVQSLDKSPLDVGEDSE